MKRRWSLYLWNVANCKHGNMYKCVWIAHHALHRFCSVYIRIRSYQESWCFDIEWIDICDGGASDHVEVANHDDSRCAPNTVTWSWWHEIIWISCCSALVYKACRYMDGELRCINILTCKPEGTSLITIAHWQPATCRFRLLRVILLRHFIQ